jgi:hypothetical protein
MLDFITINGLDVANDQSPTCRHQGAATINDLTFTKNVEVNNWRTTDTESLSDHEYINFNIPIANMTPRPTRKNLNVEKMKEEMRTNLSLFEEYTNRENTLVNAETLTEWLSSLTMKHTEVTQCWPTVNIQSHVGAGSNIFIAA